MRNQKWKSKSHLNECIAGSGAVQNFCRKFERHNFGTGTDGNSPWEHNWIINNLNKNITN